MTRSLLRLFPALALAACSADLALPEPSLEGLPPGLDVQFTVSPNVVDPHQPFSAALSVTNTTSDTIRVVTAMGCLAIPHVMRDGERIPFRGSWWACTAAIATHAFAPGETRSHTWDMRAELYAEHAGDVDGAPAPSGTYSVQAEFGTYTAGGPSHRPTIARSLRVR